MSNSSDVFKEDSSSGSLLSSVFSVVDSTLLWECVHIRRKPPGELLADLGTLPLQGADSKEPGGHVSPHVLLAHSGCLSVTW